MNVFAQAWENMKRSKRKLHPAAVVPTENVEVVPVPNAHDGHACIVCAIACDCASSPCLGCSTCGELGEGPTAAALVAPPAPPPSTSDEGVLYEWVSSSEIVNLSDDPIDSRRRELHVAGCTYHHVADTLGHWLYRRDA